MPYSLWEYVIADETTWTVLHHYALKKGKRRREEDEAEVTTSAEQIQFAQHEYQPVATDSDMTYLQHVPVQDNSFGDSGEAMIAMDPQHLLEMHLMIGDNGMTETLSLNDVNGPIMNEDIVGEDQPSYQSAPAEIVSNVMQEDDHLLPYIPTYMYYQLLNKSISEKRFFNVPIQVHEELFRFKFKCMVTEEDDAGRITESEAEEVLAIDDLTRDNFEFITVQKRIHIVSPAGTGKTMAMLQLAKSFEREQHNLVTVVCKSAAYICVTHSCNRS
jgi:flagellar biosynthesis GTPase FlhF